MRQQVGCEPRTHPGDPGILYGGGHPLCGGGPYDRRASQAINEGKSLADVDCPARDALYHIFQAVCGLLGLRAGELNAGPLK